MHSGPPNRHGSIARDSRRCPGAVSRPSATYTIFVEIGLSPRVSVGWAYLGLNQGPPACEAGALPLSYTPGKRPGMLADGGCAPAEPAPLERSGRDSNPRDELTPPTRFPVALLQPLGHHSRPFPVSHGGPARKTPSALFPLRATFRVAGRLRRVGWSRSFPLAPSASRSRLKLRRGTEAFRGNGTLEGWTKRQAFGHFVFGWRARAVSGAARGGPESFSRCERFFAFRALAPAPPVPLLSVSHRALSRKQTKLRRGVGSPSG